MRGKVTIHQEPNGWCTGIDLDGQKLPHVRSYAISHTVGDLQLVTVTFLAAAEIISDTSVEPRGGHVDGRGGDTIPINEPQCGVIIDGSNFYDPHRVTPRD